MCGKCDSRRPNQQDIEWRWLMLAYSGRDADDLHFDEDEQGMVESQRQINQLIREERDILIEAGKEPRIALAGFSQGASISLAVTLTSDEPIEALIMMSGYIPMPDKLRINSAVQQDVPVFWGHGRYDPDITVDHAAEDVKALRLPPYSLSGLRFRVSWNAYLIPICKQCAYRTM